MRRFLSVLVVIATFILIGLTGCPNAGTPGDGDSGNPPPVPTLTSTAGEVNRVTVEFDLVDGATSYRVYYAAAADPTKSDTYATTTGSPFTYLGIPGANTYRFAVSALNEHGESGLSNVLEDYTRAVANELDWDEEMDYVILQSPTSTSDPADTIYGRVYEELLTEAAGANGSITAELGYGPYGSNPITDDGWTYITAVFSAQYGNDDEYEAVLPGLPAGSYSYVFRFTKDDLWYTYADTDGAGSNATFDFSAASTGTLTAP